MDQALNIALLGGSFDPPHRAHLEVARHLLQEKGYDEVWVVPARQNPLKQTQASFENRLAMCRLLFGATGRVRVLDDDAKLSGYTVDLARHLTGKFPMHRFVFVGGSDLQKEIPRWKEAKEVEKLLDFEFLARPPEANSPFSPISSTAIREAIKKGLPIDQLLPKAVEEYIHENNLYSQTSE
jgi:cytidyltransferase-related domain